MAFVLAGAALLRLRSIEWGLPGLSEEATPFRKAVEFWGAETGHLSFDPHFFNYPSLTFYLHFAIQAAAAAIGFVTGAWHSLDEFRSRLTADPAPFIRLARWTTALIAVATIVPVYATARRIGGIAAALAAALFLAVNPLHAAQARFIGTDIPLAFCAAMALYHMVRLASLRSGAPETATERSLWRRTGLWIGLAASAKYPGFLLALLLPVLLLFRREEPGEETTAAAPPEAGGLPCPEPEVAIAPNMEPEAPAPPRREAATGPASALKNLRDAVLWLVLAFAVTSPFVIFDLPDAIQALRFERYHMLTGHLGATGRPAIIDYLTEVLPYALGWPGLLVAALGLVALAARRGAGRLIVLFAVMGLITIGAWKVAADRYLLLVIPALVIAQGFVFSVPRGRRAVAPLALAALAVMVPGGVTAWREGTLRGRPTTRAAAVDWVRRNVPAGSPIAVENYSVETLSDSLPLLVIPFDAVRPHVYDPAYSLPYYAPFDYVVLSSALYNRYLSRMDDFPAQVTFYEGVSRDFDPVAVFEPGRHLVGPTIRIFRRKAGAGRPDFREIPGSFYNSVAEPLPLARFLTSLGAVLAEAGRDDLALAAAEQAVALAPDDARSLTNMASLRARRGDYLTALKAYQRALELAPRDPVVHYNLGRLYMGKELYGEAAASFLRALDYNPRLADAYLSLAICQVHLNEVAGAKRTLRRFLETFPGHPQAAQAEQALKELS